MHNNYRLKVITGPTLEPVTIDYVKTHTHITHNVEDLLLQTLIKSARELAESYQKRAYLTQTLEMSFDMFPSVPLSIPRCPLASVTSIKYFDYLNVETTFSSANYYVDTSGEPGRIMLGYSLQWPAVTLRPIDSVRIRFIAGAANDTSLISQNVIDAILMYCTWRYENRAVESGSVPEAFYTLLRHDRI